MATKIICDICKKEINGKNYGNYKNIRDIQLPENKVKVEFAFNLRNTTSDHVYDVCRMCMDDMIQKVLKRPPERYAGPLAY